MNLRKAAEMALEALDAYSWEQVDAARTALRQALEESANSTTDVAESKALAQPEQEPVAIVNEGMGGIEWLDKPLPDDTPLYTSPPKQSEQEQIYWKTVNPNHIKFKITVIDDEYPHGIPIEQWRIPPKREWVGLTRRELDIATLGLEDLSDCYKAIEAKLKEKNNG